MQVKKIDNSELINKVTNFVKNEIKDYDSGHSWFHIDRVRRIALDLQEKEGGDRCIVELSALLHDVGDAKFYLDENMAEQKISGFLSKQELSGTVIDEIIKNVKSVSFNGGKNKALTNSIEFQVVQDADRLDAIGAIGIARAFHYGGFKNREIYNPKIKPVHYETKEEYRKSNAPTINHFYEKLLLLVEQMNTESGKKLAKQRHEFMLNYLEQFYHEWNIGDSI